MRKKKKASLYRKKKEKDAGKKLFILREISVFNSQRLYFTIKRVENL